MILYTGNIKKNITADNPWFKQARELYIRVFKDSVAFCDVVLNNAKGLAIEVYDSKVVSCAFVREKMIKTNNNIIKVAFMFGVATDEEFRHKGYSRKVIESVFEHLKTEYEYLLLCPANASIYDFYSKFGFKSLTYFSYKKGVVVAADGIIVKGSINDVNIMYDIFTSNTKNIDVIQQRTLSQTKTRLDEVFSDNGELFFIERNGEKVGYYLLEDGKHISEHINVDIKFDKNKDFEIVCFGRKLTERNKCPGVIIKSLNGGSVNSIRGIEFFEMW